LAHFRRFWTPHLDVLATELARGKCAAGNRPFRAIVYAPNMNGTHLVEEA
jgi:hypothetical protein